ncbi:hypothetical protein ABZX30_38045, partial [Streptomyces sp. NPDC004542]|uniref:hypothetical protein n=1 Tax=Streptomyces sp. NPDC004542 TaxID=3154281 RepID=UPI0033B7DC0E
AAFTGAARWPSAVDAGWGAPRAARARAPHAPVLDGAHRAGGTVRLTAEEAGPLGPLPGRPPVIRTGHGVRAGEDGR